MKNILILFVLLFSKNILAQEEPKLSGTLEISIKEGTMDGDFVLSDIPNSENYYLFINTGLNIQYFKNEKNENISFNKIYDNEISYESFLYTFRNKNKQKYLPNSINVKYSGKFPVHQDTTNLNNTGDWKGNIAFNGKLLRMDGYQTSFRTYDAFKFFVPEITFLYIIMLADAKLQRTRLNFSPLVDSRSSRF